MTGVLAPGLVLGAAGLTVVQSDLAPGAAAQSVFAAGACTAFGAPAAQATDLSAADVAEKVNPAVVTVINLQPMGAFEQRSFTGIDGLPDIPGLPGIDELPGIGELPGMEPAPGTEDGNQQIEGEAQSDTLVPTGTGSGFIVDVTGHVVTNAHVVSGAQEVLVYFADGTEVPASVVGSDGLLDVAVLLLDLSDNVTVPGIVSFGDSGALRAGDDVIAIGSALGSFPNTVSTGTVNAVDRAFPSEGGLTNMIQHDAEIWHGNSGGPLLNLGAEVVGINTAGIGSGMMGSSSGPADMAFAVEGNTVCRAAAVLIADGEISWPYLGIQAEPSNDGQSVVEVVSGGPAADSGIAQGDVITAFDGSTIDRQHSLLDLLFERVPGDVVTITVDRDGRTETFQVTLGERPESAQ
jgi:S1-C subfamily serine protease